MSQTKDHSKANSENGGSSTLTLLIEQAASSRPALENLRDEFVGRLRRDSSDWQATAGLTKTNEALANIGWDDSLDWRKRWARGRKP